MTVPIGSSGGALPRFMQSTAAARQRSGAEKPEQQQQHTRPLQQQQPNRARPTVTIPVHQQKMYAKQAPPQHQQQQQQRRSQENNQKSNVRVHVTVPETPQWVRNAARGREKPRVMSTEEKEMAEVQEKKRQLAEIARVNRKTRNFFFRCSHRSCLQRNRERLGAMQGVAQHETRYLRAASAFTPKKSSNQQPSRPPTQLRPTVPQAFSFATDRRR